MDLEHFLKLALTVLYGGMIGGSLVVFRRAFLKPSPPVAAPAPLVRVDRIDTPAGTAEDFRRELLNLPDESESLEGFLDRWRGRLPAPPPSPSSSSPASAVDAPTIEFQVTASKCDPDALSAVEYHGPTRCGGGGSLKKRLRRKMRRLARPVAGAVASTLFGPLAGGAIASAFPPPPFNPYEDICR